MENKSTFGGGLNRRAGVEFLSVPTVSMIPGEGGVAVVSLAESDELVPG